MRLAAFLVALTAGCAAGLHAQRLPPLEKEGEVFLYALPFPHEAERLAFTLAAVSAVREDGSETPLELVLPALTGPAVRSQRLLAWGRLPPGSYTGFTLKTTAATLSTSEGRSALLVPPEPTRIELLFRVAERSATVASLTFRYAESVEQRFGFTPVFSAAVPARTLAPLIGFCSDTGSDELTVFDRRMKLVTGIVPTGRAPRGLALDAAASRLYVALSEEDQIDVVDVASGESVQRIRLTGGGDRPQELLLSRDGRTLVTINQGSRTASFVDVASGQELSRVPVGESPASLLLDRSGLRAYVFNRRSNTVTVLDVGQRSVAATLRTDAEPLRGQVNRAGDRLYVIYGGSQYLDVFSLPDFRTINRVFIGLGASALKVDPRTDLVYVGFGNADRVQVYDPFSFLPVDEFAIPGPAGYLAIDDSENTLHVLMPERHSVAVIDLTSRSILAILEVGPEPYAVTMAGERF